MVKHLHHTALKMEWRVTRQCEEACLSKVTRACAPKSERGGEGRGGRPRERGGPLSLPLSEALQYLSSAPLPLPPQSVARWKRRRPQQLGQTFVIDLARRPRNLTVSR